MEWLILSRLIEWLVCRKEECITLQRSYSLEFKPQAVYHETRVGIFVPTVVLLG